LVKNNGNYTIVHDKVGWILTIVQTGAILEVFHVIIDIRIMYLILLENNLDGCYGAGSEAMLIYQSLPYSKQLSSTYYWFEVVILITYIPGFFVMYTHMISQRRKYLGGSKGKGKSKKNE
ncbi:2660_t:CDS:2, partial [Diversispora eburnea]